MHLEKALRSEHSKFQTRNIAAWVGSDPRRFAELFALLLGGDRLLSQRAAWVVGDCVEAHPGLIRPHIGALLRNLERPGLHPAIPRHSLRLLQFVTISGVWEGKILEIAMASLGGTAPVAVKASAMTLIRRLADGYPDILEEARRLIDEQWAEAGPAFRARARREFGR
jgi:hypothetical protein